MQFKHILGIDISKLTLDLCLLSGSIVLDHLQIANDPKDIKKQIPKLLKTYGINLTEVLFSMEHTGIYNTPVVRWLESQKAHIWVLSAIEIKRSMGMVRGKSDKIDCERIALYTLRNQDKLNLWIPASPEVIKLSRLLALRAGLIKSKKQLSVGTN